MAALDHSVNQMHEKMSSMVLRHAKSDNELGAVLRCAVLLEIYVTRYVELACEQDGILKKVNFSTKIRLARNISMDLDAINCIQAFTDIRNRFAHSEGGALSEEDIEVIRNKSLSLISKNNNSCVGGEKEGWVEYDPNTGEVVFESSYSDLDNKMKFIYWFMNVLVCLTRQMVIRFDK